MELFIKEKKKKTHEFRAIKVIEYEKIIENLLYEYDSKQVKEQLQKWSEIFMKEYNIMDICSKNNINSVKCYEYFNNDKNFVIIMELCEKDLSKALKEKIIKTGKGFDFEEIREIFNQLNNTFKVMKENNIIHIEYFNLKLILENKII